MKLGSGSRRLAAITMLALLWPDVSWALPCHPVAYSHPSSLKLARVGYIGGDGRIHITWSMDVSSPTGGVSPKMQTLVEEAMQEWTDPQGTTNVVFERVGSGGDLHVQRVPEQPGFCAQMDGDDGVVEITDGLNHVAEFRADLRDRVRWAMKHEIGHFLGLGR